MKLKRFFTLLLSVLLISTVAMAQSSSGDRLYSQGLAAQKVMTVASQKDAIKKFQSAKKLYDSAAKKAQCDQAISVSQGIIKSLQGGGGTGQRGSGKNTKTDNTPVKTVEPTLELDARKFEIDLNAKILTVNIHTNQNEWNVYAAARSDGSSFLSAQKSGNNSFQIAVTKNNTYETRSQTVFVTTGDLKREITVIQTGRHVSLTVNNQSPNFKAKGGKQKIEVFCNADLEYEANSNENWYVESKPDWTETTVNMKKESKGIMKYVDMAKDKADVVLNGKDNSSSGDAIKSSFNIICDPITKGSQEANSGRKGEIVLRSGDSTVTIYVSQSPY